MATKTKKAPRRPKKAHPSKPRGISNHEFARVHWPYLPIVLAIGFLLSFGIQSGTLQAAIHNPRTKVLNYATSMSIGGLLSATNSARAANGVTGLQLNSKLNNAAQAKANDMATKNYWSHYTPAGDPPWIFVTAQGYSYQKLGENLATGFSNEQTTINGWMASPPHRENLLDSAFTQVGFGYANNPSYTSAGGGPMTIMVAFYGRPTVLAASHSAAPPAPTPVVTPPPTHVPPPATPTRSTLVKKPTAPSSPVITKALPVIKKPETTQSPSKGVSLALRTSNAELAFAKLPAANFATGLVIFALVATIGLWVSRHLLMLRRVWLRGEAFAIHHPLMDVGFLVIAVLLFLMSQTAGLIQ